MCEFSIEGVSIGVSGVSPSERGSFGSVEGDSSVEVPLVRPEVALLFRSEFDRRGSIILVEGNSIREVLMSRSEGGLVRSELGSIELDQSCLDDTDADFNATLPLFRELEDDPSHSGSKVPKASLRGGMP
ncbi:hypothetical protein Tco_0903077 [Tanacetum coccineum]